MRSIQILCVVFAIGFTTSSDAFIHLQTSLPVADGDTTRVSITDRDGLVIFEKDIIGKQLDILFPFVASDLDGDEDVDLDDFAIFVDWWSGLPVSRSPDFDGDGKVGFQDFFIFADQFGLRLDEAAAKLLMASAYQDFARDLEVYAVQFGANLADPAVQARIRELRRKLTGEEYNNIIGAGYNISLDGVKLYNVLGQTLDANKFPTTSGIYFATFGSQAVRFSVLSGEAWVNGSRVSNLRELAQHALPKTRVVAKIAASGFSFTVTLVSQNPSLAPVVFNLDAPAPGQSPEIIGTLEEISGSPQPFRAMPQAILGLPVVALTPGQASSISLSSLFTVEGAIQSGQILSIPDGIVAILDGLTLVVSGLTDGEIRQVQVEITDEGGLTAENTVSVRSPVITRLLAVTPADTSAYTGTEESVPARGELATLYDGVVSKTELVALTLVGYEVAGAVLTVNYSYEELTAAQTIIILPPADANPPRGSLKVEGSNAIITASDAEDSVHVELTAGLEVLLSGWFASVDESIPLNLPEFSTTVVRLSLMDKAGNGPVVYEAEVAVGDKTPPDINAEGSWGGGDQTSLALNVSASDNKSLGEYSVVGGSLNYASNANGRTSINFSPTDATFSRVTQVTPREVRLHACDQSGNCSDKTQVFNQPVSPAQPSTTPATSGGGGGGSSQPPPPALTAPSFSSATFNGNAAGTYFSVSVGQAITVSFSGVSGNPSPTAELQVNTGLGWSGISGVTYTPSTSGPIQIRGRLYNGQSPDAFTAASNVTVQGGGAP